MNGPCTVCDGPYADLVDTLLLQGHSFFCVSWHLRRLGFLSSWDRLEDHIESHRCYTLHPDQGIGEVSQWKYTPPAVLRVPLGQRPELLLIRGIPYSGKTRMALLYGATHVHIEADQFYFDHRENFTWDRKEVLCAHHWAQLWTRHALASRHNVVVANTFLLNQHLETYYGIAEACGADVAILDMPRRARPPWRLQIPKGRLTRMQNLLEPLTFAEKSWQTQITQREVPEDYTSLPIPLVPYFCQPFVCRHSHGAQWLATVAASLAITEEVEQADKERLRTGGNTLLLRNFFATQNSAFASAAAAIEQARETEPCVQELLDYLMHQCCRFETSRRGTQRERAKIMTLLEAIETRSAIDALTTVEQFCKDNGFA